MNVSRAAARVYARALFDLGLEEGLVGRIYDDLHAVLAAIRGLDPDLRAFFSVPKLRRDEKKRILTEAFGDKVCRPVLGLIHVLVDRRREPFFDNIVDEFDRFRDDHEGRVHATCTAARPLDPAILASLKTALEKRTRKHVALHERIDPAVLGGIRINLGDYVLDGTVRRRLMELRRTFAAAEK